MANKYLNIFLIKLDKSDRNLNKVYSRRLIDMLSGNNGHENRVYQSTTPTPNFESYFPVTSSEAPFKGASPSFPSPNFGKFRFHGQSCCTTLFFSQVEDIVAIKNVELSAEIETNKDLSNLKKFISLLKTN